MNTNAQIPQVKKLELQTKKNFQEIKTQNNKKFNDPSSLARILTKITEILVLYTLTSTFLVIIATFFERFWQKLEYIH